MQAHSHTCEENLKDVYNNYEFELHLVDAVTSGDVVKGLLLFNNFFRDSNQINTCYCKTRSLKNHLINLSCLLCHGVIKKGVSPYDAKSKSIAFIKIIEQCGSVTDLLKVGEKLIKGYAMQVTNSFIKTKEPAISTALCYIHSNFSNELTLDMVAEHVKLSKCYFSGLFKKEVGVPFCNYLNQVRVEKSKFLLLHTDESLIDIAIQLGFNSQSYFSTQFKKYTGVTPKQYRSDNK